jgi:Transposase IS66 family
VTAPDQLLVRLQRRKPELLKVLERQEIPLHTNASENDIRACVIKRKISGGTMSDKGRQARGICCNVLVTGSMASKLSNIFGEFRCSRAASSTNLSSCFAYAGTLLSHGT